LGSNAHKLNRKRKKLELLESKKREKKSFLVYQFSIEQLERNRRRKCSTAFSSEEINDGICLQTEKAIN
jgi:hypothetical protein